MIPATTRRYARMSAVASSSADASYVSDLLTVVVCSSPVPSNPETQTIRAVFHSLSRATGLAGCAKIIHFDGPQAILPPPRIKAYAEFKARVRELSEKDGDFSRSSVYESDSFLFSAHNLAAAISHVNTSFLLNLQHDYELAKPFDAPNLLRTMLALPIVRHVRLNMRPNYPPRGFDGVVANASGLLGPKALVPLTRTCGWSDSPHVASTSYYRDFVIPKNKNDHKGGRRKFMEESVHYPMQRNGMKGEWERGVSRMGCFETRKRVEAGETDPIPWPSDFDDYGTYLYGYCTRGDGFYTRHRSPVGTGRNGVWSTIRWATREEAARAAVARCTVEVRAAVEAGRRKEEGVEEGGGRRLASVAAMMMVVLLMWRLEATARSDAVVRDGRVCRC